MGTLPTGTVTFLFTDVESSTRLWEEHPAGMRGAMARHDAVLRLAVLANGGQVVKTTGDGLHAAFARPEDALRAALEAQRGLIAEPWELPSPPRVRMGVHAGTAEERDGDYYGPAVNRAARVMAAAHGGQVLLSGVAAGLARPGLDEGVGLRDLGEHRLKDLGDPERLFQLTAPDLVDGFAAVRSLDLVPNNLPAQLTSLIGRERELLEIVDLLRRSRLVTLTGAGGAGKTRLSLQVAAELLEAYADGVWFVDLAPVSDGSLLVATVAASVGVEDVPGHRLLDVLTASLRTRTSLIVLDNCEHLLGAAAELVDHLLRRCPGVRILATSRELLGIGGETAWRVPSLTVPDRTVKESAEAVGTYGSVRLFIERARAVRPEIALTDENAGAVARICSRLDGIPLAIELAAARARSMGVDQIAARLDDRFRLLTGGSRTALRRQQTLQALVDWSHDLLSEPERALLRRLAVFNGGWTLEAAEAVVTSGDVGRGEVLDLLASLVDKSLVVLDSSGGSDRYRFLETMRQYAESKLLAADEAETYRDRHLGHVLALVERAGPELFGSGQIEWLDRLEGEYDNIRAAIVWAETRGELAARLGASLGPFWSMRRSADEGWQCLDALLRADEAVGGPTSAARAAALAWAAMLMGGQNHRERSIRTAQQAILAARAVGDPRAEAVALTTLSWAYTTMGDDVAARRHGQAAVAVARAAADDWTIAWALGRRGANEQLFGDRARARALLEEAVAAASRLGDRWIRAHSLEFLGVVSYFDGQHGAARTYLEQSRRLWMELGSRYGVARIVRNLARIALTEGDTGAARDGFAQTLRAVQEFGGTGLVWLAVDGMAGVAASEGSHRRALRLAGATAALRQTLGVRLFPGEAPELERWLAPAYAELGPEASAAALAEGRGMTVEQAIELALEPER